MRCAISALSAQTSSTPPTLTTLVITLPDAGSVVSKVAPSTASTNLPSMKSLREKVREWVIRKRMVMRERNIIMTGDKSALTLYTRFLGKTYWIVIIQDMMVQD